MTTAVASVHHASTRPRRHIAFAAADALAKQLVFFEQAPPVTVRGATARFVRVDARSGNVVHAENGSDPTHDRFRVRMAKNGMPLPAIALPSTAPPGSVLPLAAHAASTATPPARPLTQGGGLARHESEAVAAAVALHRDLYRPVHSHRTHRRRSSHKVKRDVYDSNAVIARHLSPLTPAQLLSPAPTTLRLLKRLARLQHAESKNQAMASTIAAWRDAQSLNNNHPSSGRSDPRRSESSSLLVHGPNGGTYAFGSRGQKLYRKKRRNTQ